MLKTRESVVIFITDKDVLGGGEPIYIIDRVIRKSGKPFNDGAHIIYVNSSHQDLTTELGRLMHDFKCAKPEEMLNPVISAKVNAMKGGGKKMGVWQEMKAEAITETSENIARKLIKAGKVAFEEIAEACGLTLQRVQELAKSAN